MSQSDSGHTMSTIYSIAGSALWIAFAVAVAGATCLWLCARRRRRNDGEAHRARPAPETPERARLWATLIERLRPLGDEYETDAVAYHLYTGAAERGLSLQRRAEISERYGKVLARPSISLSEHLQVEDYAQLDATIERIMTSEQFPVRDGAALVQQWEDALYTRAERNARAILEGLG